jgi:hypothetical protein
MACTPPPVSFSDPRSLADLAEPLRSRVHTLILDYRGPDPIWLKSGKRTPYLQFLLRQQHGCRGRECDRACKGTPTTAVPGSSKHETGEAADLAGDLAHVARVAKSYGLALTVPGEPWHVQAVGTPTVPITPFTPGRLVRWVGFAADRIQPPAARPFVVETQTRLRDLSRTWRAPDLDPLAVDGLTGPETAAAVSAFKRRIIDLQRATHQATWPNVDTWVGDATIAMLRWWTP